MVIIREYPLYDRSQRKGGIDPFPVESERVVGGGPAGPHLRRTSAPEAEPRKGVD